MLVSVLPAMLIEEKIFSLFDQSQHILIISHRKPDGDTLGSAGACLSYLKERGKNCAFFCSDEIPENLKFIMPNDFRIINNKEQLNLNEFDLAVALDCGDIRQTAIDEILKARQEKTFLINIDHHFTNNNYGNLNLVDFEASSTSEIIFRLFKKMRKPLDRVMTNALLTGILSDTTYFSNAATTIEAISASSDLLNYGAKLKKITESIWKNKDTTALKMWGRVFERLVFDKEKEIVTAIITEEDFLEFNIPDYALDGLANYLTSLYEARIIVLLYQNDANTIKGSLRTTRADVDVSEIAKKFGGGGHRKAAGFSAPGKLTKFDGSWLIDRINALN